MKLLFVQLPVPTLVPQQNVGNHLLASSSLYLHLQTSTAFLKHDISALSQDICSRAGDNHIVELILGSSPDIVAFTCAVWNIERTLYIARKIKSTMPQVKVWLGGPEIASDSFFMSDKNPPFDLAVEGEGEQIFRLLLEGYDPEIIARVHVPFSTKENKLTPELIRSLDTINEPFIKGFARMEQDGVLTSEFFRGCKYGCLFCRYHNGSGKKVFAKRSYQQVESLFSWARINCTKEIFLLDPSFEQRPDIDQFLEFLSEINRDPVIPIFAELRAESVDEKLAEKLYHAGVLHVETGLQTVTAQALRNVGRTFDKQKFISGIRHLQSVGIKIRSDIMIGLPGDTPEGLQQTASFLKELQLNRCAQVFKTQVLPGTNLRRKAQHFSIEFERRPPYQVISTPQWNESQMADAIYEAESLLDISCQPEERPIIHYAIDSRSAFEYLCFVNIDTVYAYYFDMTNETGRMAFAKEKYTKASFTVSMTIKVDNYHFIHKIKTGVANFYQTNPFSASVVAFQIPPQFPLDLFDAVLEIRNTHSFSNYLSSLYPSTYSSVPNRRIFACLEISLRKLYSEEWLDSLRELSEIIWIPDEADDFFRQIDTVVESMDYVYVSKILSDKQNLSFDKLAVSSYSEQYIFSDIERQWSYLEYLNNNQPDK